MTGRVRIFLSIMLTVLMVFAGRLVYLQLVMAQEYEALSTQNFMIEQRISPLRGRILARDGTVLADSRIAYDLMYRGGGIENWDRIMFLLDLTGEELREPDTSRPDEAANGVAIVWNIPDRVIPALQELLAGQGNAYLRERIERTYPTTLAAQVVGYTTLADPVRFPGYALDELVGLMGLEAGMERELFGAAGSKLLEVDNRRVVLRERTLVPPQPGNDITLTLDPTIQRWAEDVLVNAVPIVNTERTRWGHPHISVVRGSLLALDLKTGEILAMASVPSFDQNIFTHRPSDPERVNAVLNDSDYLPLLNRSVEAYAPASLFKPITSFVLLENGYTTRNERYACSASLNYGGRTWLNWATYHRGNYTSVEAIADSCNTYYWNAAIDTPGFSTGWAPFVQDLMATAREFGLGSTLGIGLPEEKPGRVPDEAWKRQATGEPWYPGFTLNMAIGQGDLLATPLQMLQVTAALALDGAFIEPHLISHIGGVPTTPVRHDISGSHWDLIHEGMVRMVTDHGSNTYLGRPAGFTVSIAGKTGTAENGRSQGLEHAWFMGYAPADDPQIAIVVFIENGGFSSSVAVPVAANFLKLYFNVDGIADASR